MSRNVPTYLKLENEAGEPLTIFFPNVMTWETKSSGEVEITMQTGLVITLAGARAKQFAEVVGDREPETSRIVVPDIARGGNLKVM